MPTPLRLRALLAFVCLTILAAPPLAAANASEKAAATKASEPFSISYSQPDTPEFRIALQEMDQLAASVKRGNTPPEQLEIARLKLDAIRERSPMLINVESKGGPLSEFVRVASRRSISSLTIINMGEPADLETPLPPFTLRNASWHTVINVLGQFMHQRGFDLFPAGGGDLSQNFVCMLRRRGPTAEDKKRAEATAATDLESIQLGEYLNATQTIEAVVDVIRAAWELDPARDPAALKLKFHPPTKILLVSGPAPAGQITRQVISGLSKNPVQR